MLIGSEPLVVVGVNMENQRKNVLLDPFAEGGLGNAVFFAELELSFSILVE